jgi:hypothetical protein
MNEQTKLILANMQVDNIVNLMAGNEWEKYFVSHLIPIKCEIERQLSLYKKS